MTIEAKAKEAGVSCCGAVEGRLPETIGAEGAEELARLAAVFKALSDGTRLRILRSLMRAEAPLCECEIVPLFGLSQPTISYHLKVLREAGVVESERRGQWAYYRVNPRALLGVVRDLAEMA